MGTDSLKRIFDPFRSLLILGLFAALASACGTTYPKCLGECVNGRGTLIQEGGDQYVGEFKDGQRHGYGTFNASTHEHYSGEWQAGLRHGQGTQVWTDGKKFIGEFKQDRKNGQGTIFYPNGDRETGRWENDKPIDTTFYKDR